jgi:ADP-heptose:LPS heptosyltransferase
MKHEKKQKKAIKKPGWLLVRFGGMGDSLFLTSAARVLTQRGYAVTVAAPKSHAEIFANNPDIAFVPLVRRAVYQRGSTGEVYLAQSAEGHLMPIEAVYESFRNDDPCREWRVTDFCGIIEGNTMRPFIGETQNSDFVNTYDMHLSWCGIDPATIADELKRPVYMVSPKERAWAEGVLANLPRPVVMIQSGASAPARTYMRGKELAKKLIDDGATVLYWNGQQWHFDGAILPIPEGMGGIRATGALVSAADTVISVDTFISHLAEAIGTQHLTLYSTVPAWTRSKYYSKETTVDASGLLAEKKKQPQGCYCHVITNGRCPYREREIIKTLDNFDRLALASLPPEIKMQYSVPNNLLPDPGFKPPSLMPGAIRAMQEAAATKWNSLRHAESFCIESVDLYDYYKGRAE